MKFIQSSKNEKVKQWKKLLNKKEREKSGLFIIEGEHLVEEANKSALIQELIVTETVHAKLPKAKYSGLDLYVIANDIANVISDTETPQGIFAVCKQFKVDDKVKNGTRYLLLDEVQDPGNLGTMIRTADAVGVDAVIVGNGSVDIYNPKVLRSAQGSHFHLPVLRDSIQTWIDWLKSQDIPVFGTALENGESMYEVSSGQGFGLIVGNEGQGVSEKILKLTDKNLFIPIYGKSESLNVSIATGILLYHLRGQ